MTGDGIDAGETAAATAAAALARQMWSLFEPVHAVIYFTDEGRAAFGAAGLRGFWRGYFAGRAAPLGPVAAAPVIASFFSFAPPMVTRALPAVWDLVTPAAALAARQHGAVAALDRVLGAAGRAGQAGPVGEGLLAALDGLDGAGRVLGAANAALPVPGEPLARLWHAATVLREHRGDGHYAAVLAAGLDGAEVLALRSGLDLSREVLQPVRGWTDEQWDAAVSRLAGRGLLARDGTATEAGRDLHARIEAATDRAASRPWAALGPAGTASLAAALAPLAQRCRAELPDVTPIGLPASSPPAATATG